MAYIPRSSLIPNEASSAIPAQMKRRRSIHVFGLLATLIFVLSLLGAIGVFVYKDFLGKKLEEAQQALSAVSSDGSQSMIEEIRIYDEKLKTAKNLLDNHLAPSLIFEELEGSTKRTVQFNKFEFVYDPGFDAMLTLSGNTEEFSSLAVQKMQILKDSIFSEFVLQDIASAELSEADSGTEEPVVTDGVIFTVVGIFAKDILEYRSELEARTNATPEPIVPAESVTPPSTEVGGSELNVDTSGPSAPAGNPFIEENMTP